MLVRVKVERVTLDTATSRFVVILKDENQNRWLPIVVGSTEAQAIALQLENISPPRPLTHDLIKNLLESLDVNISRIVVSDLRENTYYALIGLQSDHLFQDVDARPSDAIALALRMNAPFCRRWRDAARFNQRKNTKKPSTTATMKICRPATSSNSSIPICKKPLRMNATKKPRRSATRLRKSKRVYAKARNNVPTC
jgi:bifunctional DNase/RNase